jgi:5-methylcytosine-specific restriction endonuclease McrA
MTAPNLTKVCSKCHLDLPLTAFHKQRKTTDGLRPDCKECRKGESTSYYQKNRTRVLLHVKTYTSQNKARLALYHKQWRALNRESFLRKARENYWANKERHNQTSRNNRIASKERYAATRKLYELANPDIVRFHKMQHESRKRNAPGRCTSEQWRKKCAFHGWRCIYCRVAVTPKTATIEHRKPLSRGGSNWPANLAPCCKQCNQSKNCKTETEYRAYICFQKLNTVSVAARDVMP